MKNNLKIDIVSDLVCPWCYIGQKRLQDALLLAGYDTQIEWKPYQLHPEINKSGVEKNLFLSDKFGSESENLYDHVKEIAAAESLEMNPELIKNIPNTFETHRLMWYAKQKRRDYQLAKILFEGYFAKGKDFSRTETLVELGMLAGLNKEELMDFFESDSGKDEVTKEEKKYRDAGITAVPTYIINDKYMIQGAQTADVFLEAFKQLKSEFS
ncbi:DsbA family oxidoreductase [soil metagenome]